MSRGKDLQRMPQKTLATQSRDYAYVQTFDSVPDGSGGFNKSWVSTTATPHAMAISPLTAKQKTDFMSINVEATHLIKVAHEIGVTELNQILFGVREFEILTVEDIQERGIVDWAFCKERRS